MADRTDGRGIGQLDQQACPVCGITFFEFRSQGRLGCPHDYVCFQAQLEPLIVNIHGESEHVGKRPRQSPARQRKPHPIDPPPPGNEGSHRRGTLRARLAIARRNPTDRDRATNEGRHAVQLDDLTQHSGEWLRGAGPEADIVISSRIRLARNLADFPFISRATPQDRARIEKILHERILAIAAETEVLYVNLSQLEKVDRQFLVERHLISREHAEGQGARAVAIDRNEKFSLMVNEEDHLRIQVMQSGLDLASVWEQINRIDDLIEEKVTYAFHERLGYLTACPTNVGTGMRVSVMLHLPALVITRQIDKVFRSLQKISLAVRGLYGEGSQAMGDFYQISNQITLGPHRIGVDPPGERHRAGDHRLRAASPRVPHQGKPREPARPREPGLRHSAHRADDQLRRDDAPAFERADGGEPGLDPDLNIPAINELFIRTQPAHLQKLTGGELDTADRNIERARYLRRISTRPAATATAGQRKISRPAAWAYHKDTKARSRVGHRENRQVPRRRDVDSIADLPWQLRRAFSGWMLRARRNWA